MVREIKNVIFKPDEAFEGISEKGAILTSFIIYLLTETLWIILPFPLEETEIITQVPFLVTIPIGFFLYSFIIHFISRRYSLEGRLRGLLSVWGYTCVPCFLSLIIFPLIYIGCRGKPIFYIFAAIFCIATLIWAIALLIIAIRVIYKFTLKRVFIVLFIFFCPASIFESIFVSCNETFFFQSYDNFSKIEGMGTLGKYYYCSITKDKITYKFRKPEIGETVIFVKEEDINKKPFSICLAFVDEGLPVHSWVIGECKEYIGKIKEETKNGFLVTPLDLSCKKPFGLIKIKQIKGRVCNIIEKEE
ncbi:MAG: Yip1 family protein [bacterium]